MIYAATLRGEAQVKFKFIKNYAVELRCVQPL